MATTETSIEAGSPAETVTPQTSLRSVSIVTGLTLCQLLLQFATQLVLAKYFGAASEMDAYVAAVSPPSIVALILASSLGYVLVPMVAQLRASDNDRAAAAVVSHVGICLLLLAAGIASIIAIASSSLVRLLCPGFAGEEQLLTAQLLRICAPLIVLNTAITYFNGLSQAYAQFVRPAVMGVVGTLTTLAYVVVFHDQQGIFAVAWGGLAGAVMTSFLLLPLFCQQLGEASRAYTFTQPHLLRLLRLLTPLVLAALFWRLDPLIDRYLGSQLATGNIAHLGYAWRVATALSMIGTSGLSMVAFTAIAVHAAADQRRELNAELAHAIRFFLFLMIPICVGLGLFAQPVVQLLFEHGRFQAADTAAVGLLVVLYIGAIVGTGLGDLLSRTFYAQHDTVVPVLVCAVVFLLSAAMKFVLAPRFGAAGLAAATSAYYVFNASVLLIILVSRLSPGMLAGVPLVVGRSVAASALACAVAGFVIRLPMPAVVLPAAASGAVAYLTVMRLLGDEFARKLTQRFFRTSAKNA